MIGDIYIEVFKGYEFTTIYIDGRRKEILPHFSFDDLYLLNLLRGKRLHSYKVWYVDTKMLTDCMTSREAYRKYVILKEPTKIHLTYQQKSF